MSPNSDFHVHPDYSIDAAGTVRQYCDRALEIGFGNICFTTHYDANARRAHSDGFWRYKGERVRFDDQLVGRYVDEVARARDFFAEHGLRVFCGLEIDYFPGVETEAERIRKKFEFDFIIGSVHCLDNIAISDKNEAPSYFLEHSVARMADEYFELLRQAAQVDQFDSLGHLDYYIRYGRPFYGLELDSIEIERFDPIFEILKKNGRGFEINTSQFRFDKKKFHPARKIIERAAEAGVPISSVGSDSHRPETLGMGIREASELLEKLRIEPLFPKIR